MKRVLLLLVCFSLLLFTGCQDKGNVDLTNETKHRIILDTDTGGDDAMAILMALKAPNITVEGITVLNGNVSLEQAAKNALACVELSGKTEVPVFLGSDTTYSGQRKEYFSVFGTDGMGDAGLIHPTLQPQQQNAVDFIIETVKKYPDEIEIVAIGPATNIALALDRDPETMSHVKKIWVMGSSGFGPGNATPVAEFNVYSDAFAFKRLLESNLPMTVIGSDICSDENLIFTRERMDDWEKSGETLKFLATSWESLYSFMNAGYVDICDAVCMYAVIYSDAIQESASCHAVCVTAECEAFGQVIFYKEGAAYDTMPSFESYQTQVVTRLKSDVYMSRVAALLGE